MIVQYLKNYYQSQSWKFLVSLLFFVAALLVLAVITNEIVLEKEETIDLWIFTIFHRYFIGQRLTDFMYVITQFASTPFIKVVLPFLLILLWVFKMYRKAIFAFLVGVGGLLLVYGMKIFFARPRPPYPLLYKVDSFSFPSGHATFSFVFYGTLAYFVWLSDWGKFWKYSAMAFLLLLSLLIGLSRVYLRVHYASDVVGGFCLGYSWLFLIIYAFRKWAPIS
jgi:undecaprenyl-diphosphatase